MGNPLTYRINGTKYAPAFHYFLLFLVLLVIAYWPISFHVFSLKNDALNYFLPVRRMVSEAYQHRMLPLWTPYMNLGYSLHGDMQSGVWNPVVQLFSLLGPYTLYTLQLETLLYVWLSGIGMFYLLRHFNVLPAATVMASVAFMFCGFNSDCAQFLNWIAASSFLPFVFLFYYRCLNERSIRCGVYTGIALFFLFNCSYPADFIIVGYLMIAMLIRQFLLSMRQHDRSLFRKILIPHLLIVVVFTTLSLPAILSFSQSLPLTERGEGASFEQVMSNPLHPALLSAYTTPLAVWKMAAANVTDPLERNSYMGIIGFIFLLLAFAIKLPFKLGGFCKWAVVIFALFSFGVFGGLRVIAYYLLPLMDTFRHPANAKIFTTFFSCILAGFTFHQLMNGYVSKAAVKKAVLITVSLAVIVLLISLTGPLFFFTGNNLSQLMNPPSGISLSAHLKAQLEQCSFADIVLFNTILQAPFLLLSYRYMVNKLNYRAITALAITNCVLFTMAFQPFTVVKKTTAHFTQQKIDSVIVNGYPIPDNTQTIAANSTDNEKFMGDIGCMNLYNKKIGRSDYRISPSNLLLQNEFWFNKPLREILLKNRLIYPVRELWPSAGINLALADTVNGLAIADFASSITRYSNDSAIINITGWRPDRIELTVDQPANGWIAVMQNSYPNWHLSIDGKQAALHKMNVSFMGFEVQKGKHHIVLEYRAKAIRIAFMISIIVSLVLLIAILYWNRKSTTSIS